MMPLFHAFFPRAIKYEAHIPAFWTDIDINHTMVIVSLSERMAEAIISMHLFPLALLHH